MTNDIHFQNRLKASTKLIIKSNVFTLLTTVAKEQREQLKSMVDGYCKSQLLEQNHLFTPKLNHGMQMYANVMCRCLLCFHVALKRESSDLFSRAQIKEISDAPSVTLLGLSSSQRQSRSCPSERRTQWHYAFIIL